jgi:hypothetical protein
VLKGKSKIMANIEELERLFPLLREQVGVEVSQKLAEKTEEIEASAVAAASAKAAEEVSFPSNPLPPNSHPHSPLTHTHQGTST